uniref:Uncharacterized protein n=1 Tax=Poecilia mexicana TaxID=48701 RepID=A0A3B3YM78_9TELE
RVSPPLFHPPDFRASSQQQQQPVNVQTLRNPASLTAHPTAHWPHSGPPEWHPPRRSPSPSPAPPPQRSLKIEVSLTMESLSSPFVLDDETAEESWSSSSGTCTEDELVFTPVDDEDQVYAYNSKSRYNCKQLRFSQFRYRTEPVVLQLPVFLHPGKHPHHPGQKGY